MSSSLCSLAWAALLSVTACASEPDAQTREEQPNQGSDKGVWTPTPFTCTPSQPANAKTLSLIPAGPPEGPGVAIFRQVDAECRWHEPAQVVLHNSSQTDVEISALGLDDPHFAVKPIALPYKLAAGDILPLQLDFNDDVGSFTAKLSIEASSGCVQFPVRAKGIEASEGGVIIPHPYVINFGHVAARGQSEPIELKVLDQPKSGEAPRKVGSFGSTSPNFRVEQQRQAPAAGGCTSTTVSIRLIAPQKPGVIRGQLAWEFEGEQTAALGFMEMIGVID